MPLCRRPLGRNGTSQIMVLHVDISSAWVLREMGKGYAESCMNYFCGPGKKTTLLCNSVHFVSYIREHSAAIDVAWF